MYNLDVLTQETNLRKLWPNEAKNFTPILVMDSGQIILFQTQGDETKIEIRLANGLCAYCRPNE